MVPKGVFFRYRIRTIGRLSAKLGSTCVTNYTTAETDYTVAPGAGWEVSEKQGKILGTFLAGILKKIKEQM